MLSQLISLYNGLYSRVEVNQLHCVASRYLPAKMTCQRRSVQSVHSLFLSFFLSLSLSIILCLYQHANGVYSAASITQGSLCEAYG